MMKNANVKIYRPGWIAVAIVGSLAALAMAAKRAQGTPRSAPMQVVGFRGQYCMSMGPRGWAVIAENAQRVAFGADSVSQDGKAAASYAIFGAGTLNTMPGFENPDRAVATSVSGLGSERVRFGQRHQLDRNVFAASYQTPQSEGMAFWQVISVQNGGYMIVLRTAYTAAGYWKARGPEASAVARSLHCNVPRVPAAPDPPSLNAKQGSGSNSHDGEADPEYNVWLDKEYYHNPRTGENFWVSPSQDWDQNGPQGPGYYAQHANEVIKLESGYSQ
ncbi:MAG: hypothetical protein M3O41_15845 [Pseudomonadota bacterium]|nr:hypothetical protein [Pseudomonadota bacterium]